MNERQQEQHTHRNYPLRPTQAQISLAALRWNYHTIAESVAPAKVLAVVKANAYGHGVIECARVLQDCGATLLGVAFPDEGMLLRNAGITADIMVMTPCLPEEAHYFADYNLQAVVGDISFLTALEHAAISAKTTVGIHICLDTGMSREGFLPEEVPALARLCTTFSHIETVGLMTHFATADAESVEFLHRQLQLFTQLKDFLEGEGYSFRYVHTANTAAAFAEPLTHCSLVRPGIGLYGYQTAHTPALPLNNPLRPVLRLRTAIVAVRCISAGTSVSYGRAYIAPAESNIATIPIGYGDGWLRQLSHHAECLIRGKRYPIVGTICMDLCMINLGNDTYPIGEEVVLIGNSLKGTDAIYADEIANSIGTIPYQLLVGLTGRVPRIFTDNFHP